MEYKKEDENPISQAKMNLEMAKQNTAYQLAKMARVKGLLEGQQKEKRKMGYSDEQAMDGLDQFKKELKKETDEYERLVDEEDAMRKQLYKAVEKVAAVRRKLHTKTSKVKSCKSGKERNVKGRCVKPKTSKVKSCKSGKERNSKGRCVKQKEEEDYYTPSNEDEFYNTPPSS